MKEINKIDTCYNKMNQNKISKFSDSPFNINKIYQKNAFLVLVFCD